MSKIRVYELAQKMGVDNREIMARLEAVGVTVKNHMAVIDEADAKKLQTPAVTVKDSSKEEVRVNTGLIRRRRVAEPVVEPAVEAAPAPAAVVAPEAPPAPEEMVKPQVVEAPVDQEKKPAPVAPVSVATETAPAEKPAAVPPVEPEKPIAPVEVTPAAQAVVAPPVTPPTAVAETEPVEQKAEEKVAEKEPAEATATKARIIGRVEIVMTQKPGQGDRRDAARPMSRPSDRPVQSRPGPQQERPSAPRGGERPAGSRPTDRPGFQRPQDRPSPARGQERVMTPVPMEIPPGGDDKKKGRKRIEPPAAEIGKGPKKGGPAAKKKEPFKKTDISEKRERIFEPGPRSGKGKKREREKVQIGKKTEITVPKAIKRIIKISETITVGELAKRMGVKATDIIRALMKLGMMVTINHPLDVDTATLLAADFGYEIENVALDLDEILEAASDEPESLIKRPPVVTIMGHVDHGKTSLLDAIREANVIAGEAGGITQHIGAYDVELNGRKITFLDTPGHEAFTAMRARGAKVTDIVILVVAADDGVMPQTREAINHSKAAGVPIIVAINKIDKPDAKVDRVKQELTEFSLIPEDWGGQTIFVEVSAKKRINLESLLEMILLQADVMELKANPEKASRGTVVEARLDRGRGPLATVLVQEGTLKVGDYFVAGVHYGRVRAMQNDRGEKISAAPPSMPVEVIGFTGVPDAGDVFIVLGDERQAKEIAMHRQQKIRETELAKTSRLSLEQLYEKIQKGEVKELNTIVKADVHGSVEAVSASLRKLTTDAIRLNVLHASVGAITETDINLAMASNAIILGFNVRPEVKAQALAEKQGVDIRLYNIIYDAVDDIKKAMEGLLEPTLREKFLGRAEIREVFSVPKHGMVAGSYVLDGKMLRNAQVRLLRDNVVVYEGKMSSLRRFKDDVKEVATGYECGIGLENYNDIKIGDIIEAFEIEKVAATL